MATPRILSSFRRSRLAFYMAIAMGIFLVAYLLLLNHEEKAMAAYYKNLRQTNVELYLAKIMQARGFRTFLSEYLATHDYTEPIEEAPSFLIGRWALFPKAKRVSDDFVPDACLNGLLIQDGSLKLFGSKDIRFAATYSMTGNRVSARLADNEIMTIDVIGYGSHLHHIEVYLPNTTQPQYGYMCR